MRGLLTLLWHGPARRRRTSSHVWRRDGQPARPRRRHLPRPRHRSSRRRASERCAWATASRTTCRVACTTSPPPPISRAVRARGGSSRSGTRSVARSRCRRASILGEHCRGVVTLATQSAGCEHADQLGDTPLLLLHGTDDEILPPETSAWCRCSPGTAKSCCCPARGTATQAAAELRERLSGWIPARFARPTRSGTGELGDDAGELVDVVVAEHDVATGPTPRAAVATAR